MYYRAKVSRKKVTIVVFATESKESKIDEHVWCPRGSNEFRTRRFVYAKGAASSPVFSVDLLSLFYAISWLIS